MYSPGITWARKLSEFNVELVFALLAIGLLALVAGNQRILGTAMLSCMVLCLHLKSAGNDALVYAKPNQLQKIKVSQINVSNVNDDYPQLLALLESDQPDIVTFQEVTPDWAQVIERDLSQAYPHHKEVVRIDPYGMSIYSKIPFQKIDTFHTQHIPNITCQIHHNGETFRMISSYITPALDAHSASLAKDQLDDVSHYIKQSSIPTLAVGDFNMVYWTPEMLKFKQKCKVQNSRREASPGEVQYEHIFYSPALECVSFTNIRSEESNYLGINGIYQYGDTNSESQLKARLSSYSEPVIR